MLVRQGDGHRLLVGIDTIGGSVHRRPGRQVDRTESHHPRDRWDEENLPVVRFSGGLGAGSRGAFGHRGGRLLGAGPVRGDPVRPVELGAYPELRITDPELAAIAEQGSDFVAHGLFQRVKAVLVAVVGQQSSRCRDDLVGPHGPAELPRRAQRCAATEIPGQPQPGSAWVVAVWLGPSTGGFAGRIFADGGIFAGPPRRLGRLCLCHRAGLGYGRGGLRSRLLRQETTNPRGPALFRP